MLEAGGAGALLLVIISEETLGLWNVASDRI